VTPISTHVYLWVCGSTEIQFCLSIRGSGRTSSYRPAYVHTSSPVRVVRLYVHTSRGRYSAGTFLPLHAFKPRPKGGGCETWSNESSVTFECPSNLVPGSEEGGDLALDQNEEVREGSGDRRRGGDSRRSRSYPFLGFQTGIREGQWPQPRGKNIGNRSLW